jgi:hypothetical protein
MEPRFKEAVDDLYIILKKSLSNINRNSSDMRPYFKLYYSMVLVAIGDSFAFPRPTRGITGSDSKKKASAMYRIRKMRRERIEAREWLRDCGENVWTILNDGSWRKLADAMNGVDSAMNWGSSSKGFDTILHRQKCGQYLRRRIRRLTNGA